MNLGLLASRVLGSSSCDFQNGRFVQLKECTMRNDGRNYSKVSHRGGVGMRRLNLQISEGAFQFVNFCKGVDEPRAYGQSTAMNYMCGTSLRASTLRWRPRRPHCYAYAGFDVITGWRLLGQLPVESASSVRNKDPCFPAITERRGAADCYINQPESPYLAVCCNADSSDNGKVCQIFDTICFVGQLCLGMVLFHRLEKKMILVFSRTSAKHLYE